MYESGIIHLIDDWCRIIEYVEYFNTYLVSIGRLADFTNFLALSSGGPAAPVDQRIVRMSPQRGLKRAERLVASPRSGREQRAWSGAQRNPRMSTQKTCRAREAADRGRGYENIIR